MNLKFDAKKGDRLNSRMTGFESVNGKWNWNHDLKEWTQELKIGSYRYSSHRPCKSVRAFRRMLKNAPLGVEFKLWNKYIGCNVYGRGSKNNNKLIYK